MARKEKNEYLIQSVSLAFSLLEQFRGGVRELRVTELSRLLRISKNNVFRLLASLEARNFVERNPLTGAYQLGYTALKLGDACLRNRRLVRETRCFLEEVSHQSQETVFLAVLGSGGLVCEDVVTSMLTLRVQFPAGTCLPLHCTAAGKVILAFGSSQDLGKCNEGTIAATKALTKELQGVRDRGYAISVEEFEAGGSALAAPVRNHASRVIGVIGVVGPSCRLTYERLSDEVAPLVVRAAGKISLRMGYNVTLDEEATSPGMHTSTCAADDVCREGESPPACLEELLPTVDTGPNHGHFVRQPRLLNLLSSQTEIAAA